MNEERRIDRLTPPPPPPSDGDERRDATDGGRRADVGKKQSTFGSRNAGRGRFMLI